MSETYEELIAAEVLVRRTPTGEHERLVRRRHAPVARSLSPNSALQLLPPRSGRQLTDPFLPGLACSMNKRFAEA